MSSTYTVQRGDGIARIAWINGFFSDTVWNHPQNAALKELRKDPEILLAGDQVFVPDKEPKQDQGSTDQRHRFKMHGIPAKFQIRLLRDDEPRPNLSWEFVIDGTRKVSGTTDSDGWIRVSLMPDARQGRLSIEGGAEVYDVQFGFVDPIDTPTGVQSRLSNLGFFDGDLADAIARFQQSRELPMTGEIDQATRAALQQIFGS